MTVWLIVLRVDSWRAASRLLVRDRWLDLFGVGDEGCDAGGHVLVVVGLVAEGVQGVAEVSAVGAVGLEDGKVVLGELVGVGGLGAVVDGGGGGGNVCAVGDFGR